jgi:hypothetical protein
MVEKTDRSRFHGGTGMEKLRELKKNLLGQLESHRADPHPSDYGDGLIRGLELALETLAAIEARS